MKKLIAMFLTVALCMGLAAPAFAANGYEEVTFETNNVFGTELVGKITIDQARQVRPTRYEVPAQVTVTVTIYENRSETYLLSLRYFNETVYEGGGTSEEDVSYAMLNADGSWTEYDGRPSYEEMNAHPLSPNQPYTFTLQTDLADVVAIDCGDTHDFFTAGVVTLRCSDGAAEQPTDPSNPFTDVAADAYYVDAVKWAVDKGVTAGTSATTFSPDATCTTAQILTFLWRANGSPAPAGSHAAVPAGQYYSDAVNWAYENGLISGSTFNGDTPCTRSATVTYLWKLAGSPAAETAAFTDVAAGSEYAQAVAWAVKEGITAGTSATTFSPDNTCTRGQIVTFLYRDFAQ